MGKVKIILTSEVMDSAQLAKWAESTLDPAMIDMDGIDIEITQEKDS
jgi:hypothetical protein